MFVEQEESNTDELDENINYLTINYLSKLLNCNVLLHVFAIQQLCVAILHQNPLQHCIRKALIFDFVL